MDVEQQQQLSKADFLRNLCESINELDDIISLPELYKMYILKNFQTLCSTVPAFYEAMSPKFLKSVLICTDLMLDNESIPFQIIFAWSTSGNKETRKKHVPSLLLETVKVDKIGINLEKIFKLIEEYPDIAKDAAVKDILLKILWIHTCNSFDKPNQFPIFAEGTIKPRKMIFNTPTLKCGRCIKYGNDLNEEKGKIIVIGNPTVTLDQGSDIYTYEYYINDNCWMPLKNDGLGFTLYFNHHDTALFDDCIYSAGGTKVNSNVASSLVYKFDLKGNVLPISKLKIPRKDHQLVAFHGRLYAIGGVSKDNRLLATVECYDTKTLSWLDAPALLGPRMGMSCIVFNGVIWVIGGISKSKSIFGSVKMEKSVECFDPANNTWFERCRLKLGKVYPSTVEVNNSLYVIGGAILSDKGEALSVNILEKLVIQAHTLEWKCVGNLKIARHRCGTVAHENQIFIIGGISTQMKCVLNNIECFDTISDTWIMRIEPLPVPIATPSCNYIKR